MNKISTRTAYGEALAEIGSDPRIFVLDEADRMLHPDGKVRCAVS